MTTATSFRLPALLAGTALLLLGGFAGAEELNNGIVREYDPDIDTPTTTLVYDVALLPSGSDDAASAAARTDLDYVTAMRRHHAGALTMSQAYLSDPEASSHILKRLARAIIPNQRFEIAVLDEIESQVRRRPKLLDLGVVTVSLRPAGVEQLAQAWKFLRTPVPFIAEVALDAGPPVSRRDVQFARAMSLHHQAAVEMAHRYNADPEASNSAIGMLNLSIMVEQAQEIALMQAVVDRYPGDPATVPVDPSMIHGMEGMEGHGMHGGAAPGRGAGGPGAGEPSTGEPSTGEPATPAGHSHH